MGGCVSTPAETHAVTTIDLAKHREAEKIMKEAQDHRARETKVLLLGSGDSGKSTVLKQMRIIHQLPWTPQETETYRHLVFENLVRGMKSVLDAMEGMGITPSAHIQDNNWSQMLEDTPDIKDGDPFPTDYFPVLNDLWADSSVQQTISRGNEAALPENLSYFFGSLERFFEPDYSPSTQDIVMTRARTIGITETTFHINKLELLMVDVGGQKSERRKWIHCFQDVTSILFLVSLSGYDQCLAEDKDANQMQDAMTIWDSICHSQWFKKTAMILFLNKVDLFKKRIMYSPIKNFFPDYEGPERDYNAGRDYFKQRFGRLAAKSMPTPKPGEHRKEVYIHYTTATDTNGLKVVIRAVEDMLLKGNLKHIGLI
ncbi:guanine nucleotide binding protein, alpha subunit [Flagelloscypha sp. PMI_526]|nr:guanine nucleotide binding protein, alpha subunit [Flagelloscypha sp. PMI_526]